MIYKDCKNDLDTAKAKIMQNNQMFQYMNRIPVSYCDAAAPADHVVKDV